MLLAKAIFWICILAIPFHLWGFWGSKDSNPRRAAGYLVMLVIVCLVAFVLGIWVIR